jgi:hypothetical protein
MRILCQRENTFVVEWDGKIILVSVLTFVNSWYVTLTYLASFDDFSWHNNIVDHPLTQPRGGWKGWELYALTGGAVMCVFVFISNQTGMAAHITKFLRNVFGVNLPEIEKKDLSSRELWTTSIGSVCKALISSSSLLSTVRDYSGDWVTSGICSLVSLIGNFGATFVVLMEHTHWRANLAPPIAKILSAFISLLYSLSQGCLYSNALFNPLMLLHLLNQRPGLYSDSIGKIIFGVTALPLTIFTYRSGEVVYEKSYKVLSVKSEEKVKLPSRWERLRGGVASGFRTLALMAAAFCYTYLLSGNNLPLASIFAALCLLAFPGVAGVLHAVPQFPGNQARLTFREPFINEYRRIEEADDESQYEGIENAYSCC